MTNEAVMLLGGGGFIGTALAKRLQLEKIPVFSIKRNNAELIAQTLPKCSTVVHLASTTTPGSSTNNPQLELDNISLTLSLLEMLQQQPQTHLIYFSSGGTVYGNPSKTPVSESSLTVPLSHHGAGKVAQESFCSVLRARGHLVTILRPSNAYGPGQTLRHGFGLIRTMMEHARLGTTLTIWGDGENVRDYIYIDDIVDATLRLIQRPQDADIYNLGSGVGYSINQIKDAVEATCNTKLKASYHQARDSDVRNVVLDNTHIVAKLNWKPAITLAQGLEKTWGGLRQNYERPSATNDL